MVSYLYLDQLLAHPWRACTLCFRCRSFGARVVHGEHVISRCLVWSLYLRPDSTCSPFSSSYVPTRTPTLVLVCVNQDCMSYGLFIGFLGAAACVVCMVSLPLSPCQTIVYSLHTA